MINANVNHLFLVVAVICVAAFVAVVALNVTAGQRLTNETLGEISSTVVEANQSSLINSSNLESLDACNVYRLIETNLRIIYDYKVENLDGSLVTNIETLLRRPLDRFKITILESGNGFIVTAKEVAH